MTASQISVTPPVLVSTTGKYGDTIWALATVKEIARRHGCRVDLVVPWRNRTLLPLLNYQSYINRAWAAENWPWDTDIGLDLRPDWLVPQLPPKGTCAGYAHVYHLGWSHEDLVASNLPIIDFVAYQQGIAFDRSPLPFLDVKERTKRRVITHAFDENGIAFQLYLRDRLPDVAFEDVSKLDWPDAAAAIKSAICFMGHRSANYVLAHAVGQRVICYNPYPQLHAAIYACPWGNEFFWPTEEGMQQVEHAGVLIQDWLQEYGLGMECCAK